MDGIRFDELTKRFGAGLSRRQVLRGLVGGAGALAVTGATRQFADAQTCEERVDCESVQQPTCPDLCPAGSQPGNNRGLDGTCCTGNGTCCSNSCVNGVCSGLVPICAEVGEDCSEIDCCNGLACQVSDSTCVEQECQEAGDICEFDENCCGDLLCVGSICAPPACAEVGEDCSEIDCCNGLACREADSICVEQECQHIGEICEFDENCCGRLVCIGGYCDHPGGECAEIGEVCEDSWDCCDELVCIDSYCGFQLPNTGAGESSDSSGMLNAVIAGGAAALIAAKVLRRKPADEEPTEG